MIDKPWFLKKLLFLHCQNSAVSYSLFYLLLCRGDQPELPHQTPGHSGFCRDRAKGRLSETLKPQDIWATREMAKYFMGSGSIK